MVPIGSEQVLRFRDLISGILGLVNDDTRLPALEELLRRRLLARNVAPDTYLASLGGMEDFTRIECDALAQELTIGETYFFRHREQCLAYGEAAVPACLRAHPQGLSILSLACASGEEAYSLAILAREAAPERWRRTTITGIDLNPGALSKAAAARYGAWSLRDTSPERQQRWFRTDGRDFVLDESVTSMVRFEQGNLIDDKAGFWKPNSYDIVFCRNVLMYLQHEAVRRIITRIATSLRTPGYLFLGSAETLRGFSNDFDLRHTHGAFYYEVRHGTSRREVGPDRSDEGTVATGSAAPPIPPAVIGDSWIGTIRQASQRIEDLASDPTMARSESRIASVGARSDLSPIVQALRSERFTDALDLLQNLPPTSSNDPDAQLLKAIILAQRGETVEAERVGKALLQRDDLNAGAHYVLALCRDAAGDQPGAIEHDRMSAYLDPGFAMPRLHLGLIFRRRLESRQARAELQDALILLQREEPARLLLFGGGFNRDALMAVCRAELLACKDGA